MKTRTNQPVTTYDGVVEGLEEEAKTNGIKIFEDIKDKDGHSRFIEGNIDLIDENIPEGWTTTYKKWSLSGSHLMVVYACQVTQGSDLGKAYPTPMGSITLPKWIMDKIFPTTSNYLDAKSINFTPLASSGTTGQSLRIAIYVDKTNNKLEFRYDPVGAIQQATYNEGGRLAFDLLIDND